jgi:integrase
MGYLRKIGEKKFRIMYDLPLVDGKRSQKTETLNGVTKKQAEAILAKRKETISLGDYPSDAGMRANELFDRFMLAKNERLAATSLLRYDSLLRVYLRPAFGTLRVGSLKTTDLIAAYARWRSRQVSARTVRHAADLMRNILNRAVKWGILGRNPALAVDTDDLPKLIKPLSTVLSEAELRCLLEEARSPSRRSQARGYLSTYSAFHPAIAFAAYTGARRGEVLAVRWQDLDLKAGTVTIARSLSDTPKARFAFKRPKNDRARTICISGQLVAILRTHQVVQAAERHALRDAYDDGDLVFARPDGKPIPPWNFGASFQSLVKRAGVPRIRLHDLRDTHASLLAKAGVPIEVVSQRLGHSTISITVDRYITVYRERDAAAAEAFERLVR